MKKTKFLIPVLLLASLILFSCELIDGEKEITIDANPFAPGVVRVHVAVLDGEDVLSQKVYEQEDVNEDGAIEIYTTPGANRTFVVVAENDQGYASYYAHDTVDIDADGKAVVELEMKETAWIYENTNPLFKTINTVSADLLSWESSGIVKTEYILINERDSSVRYRGYNNNYIVPAGNYYCYLNVIIYPFGLITENSGNDFNFSYLYP